MTTTPTGWNGLLSTVASMPLLVDRNPREREMTRLARRLKIPRALGIALNGAAAGGTATATEGRVVASVGITGELGGVRAIETNTLISRATAAADETRIDNMWLKSSRPSSYPTTPNGIASAGLGQFSGRGNIIA